MSFPGRYFNAKRFREITVEYDVIWSYPGDHKPVTAPDYVPGQLTRLVHRTGSFICNPDLPADIGVAAIAIQHEINHGLGICLPWEEGVVEVEKPNISDDSSKIIDSLLSKKINIGRNDPCYCGSGKKYKKCCLNK